ncbi:MAG: hypothetical protein JJ864_07550 [Rhizobiaceae bacterium]|nr:hypothetical protein [Rhizobiaceae bacterium]
MDCKMPERQLELRLDPCVINVDFRSDLKRSRSTARQKVKDVLRSFPPARQLSFVRQVANEMVRFTTQQRRAQYWAGIIELLSSRMTVLGHNEIERQLLDFRSAVQREIDQRCTRRSPGDAA